MVYFENIDVSNQQMDWVDSMYIFGKINVMAIKLNVAMNLKKRKCGSGLLDVMEEREGWI